MKKKKIIKSFLFILLFSTFCVSSYKIISYIENTKTITNTINIINKGIIINEVKDDESSIIIYEEQNIYDKYSKMNLIDVDLKQLKDINQDTVGWIQIKNTNINYPFVQSNNNELYLKHDFNKNWNEAGWIFADYRNDLTNNAEKNTIIYGHSMLNKTMFGTLSNLFKTSWLENPDNHIILISTESENTMWQLFSIYHIETTSDYIKTDFINDEEYKAFLEMIKNRSQYNFNVDLNTSDRILTLSTCYSKTERRVVHAKLIKKISKENTSN